MSDSNAQDSQRNKRKRDYYRTPPKHNKLNEIGLKGFLCSCNIREKDCLKESYNILNDYADKLLVEKDCPNKTNSSNGEMEDELQKELAIIRLRKSRFQYIDTGSRNFLFIKTSIEKPVELALKIVEDINTTKQQKTRYLLRLIPVETVSKAYIETIVKDLNPFLEAQFKDTNRSYSVFYNHRNNNSLNRDDLIKDIANVVQALNPNSKVDLKNPEVSIVVEVIGKFAFLAVIPNFFKYKKFNLLTLSQEITAEESKLHKNEADKTALPETG